MVGRGARRTGAGLFGLLAAVLVSECCGDDEGYRFLKRPTPSDVAALRKLLAGSVVGPGDSGYANATQIQNTRVLRRPAAVIFAATRQDVLLTVAAAKEWSVKLAVRSGGHSYAGYCVSDGDGVTLDLSRMAAVAVAVGNSSADPSCSVTVEAGTQWMEVYEALGDRALVVGGGCGTVGVGGYTLGGGVGYLSRVYGLAIDNVLSYTVATAAGVIANVTASSDSDLFWALSGGGGGNFGVLIDVTFKCHRPARPAMATTSFAWAMAIPQAEQILAFYAEWLRAGAGVPDAISAYVAMTSHVLAITFFFVGTPAEGDALLVPWRALFARSPALRPVSSAAMQATSFLDFEHSQQGPGLGDGQRNTMSSTMLASIEPSVTAGLLELVRTLPDDVDGSNSGVYIMHVGGAIGRISGSATAFAHRDAVWAVGVESLWTAEDLDGHYLGWAANATVRLSGFSQGTAKAYVNYADPRLGPKNFPAMYYGSNYPRLQRIKCAVDPDGLFDFDQGVRCAKPE